MIRHGCCGPMTLLPMTTCGVSVVMLSTRPAESVQDAFGTHSATHFGAEVDGAVRTRDGDSLDAIRFDSAREVLLPTGDGCRLVTSPYERLRLPRINGVRIREVTAAPIEVLLDELLRAAEF